jgi:hypothetical protein
MTAQIEMYEPWLGAPERRAMSDHDHDHDHPGTARTKAAELLCNSKLLRELPTEAGLITADEHRRQIEILIRSPALGAAGRAPGRSCLQRAAGGRLRRLRGAGRTCMTTPADRA